MAQSTAARDWVWLWVLTVLVIWLAVASEWLFAVTKPSFLAGIGWVERLELPLLAALPLAGLASVLLAALALAGRAVGQGAAGRVLLELGYVVPAATLAGAAVLVVDNFTYTVLGFGVGSTSGGWRAFYAALYVGLFVWARHALGRAQSAAPRRRPALALLAGALIVASASVGVARYRSTPAPADAHPTVATVRATLPNILLLASDGIDAAHMSVYGYERDTTPFLRTLAADALVCENAFPNGNVTAASLVSMLTGRLPTETGVIYQPDVLHGIAAYQHLPALLRRLGYRSIHLGASYYTDPTSMNLLDGFNVTNGRAAAAHLAPPALPRRAAVAYGAELYFLTAVADRLADRLLHAVGARTMISPFAQVTGEEPGWDTERVAALLDFTDRPGPVFAHVHFMDSHGPYFFPRTRLFSAGLETMSAGQQMALTDAEREWWRTAAYDDTVRAFDDHVAAIVAHLRATGELDRTLIVVNSDHGRAWTFGRVPLIFAFPAGAHRGRITANVQLLDIAPTLLEYIGLSVPAWMGGRSLIGSPPDPLRPIVTAGIEPGADGAWRLQSLGATVCDQVFWLDLASGTLAHQTIAGHTAPCHGTGVPGDAEIRALLGARLAHADVASAATAPRAAAR